MILFASDLDNTLIHSYKKADPDDICVEVKEEKKLSFMTGYAYNKIRSLYKNPEYLFMPITTRSLEQYNRINLFDGKPARLAITSNGGILLEDGIINQKWYQETLDMIADSMWDFKKGEKFLEEDKNVYMEIRVVDGLFLFTKSHTPLMTVENLKDYLQSEKSVVFNIGDKVYIFPKIITKGMAIERIRKMYDFEKIICAGDSELDIPMLDIADMAYCPDTISGNVLNDNLKGFNISEKRLADQILCEIEG